MKDGVPTCVENVFTLVDKEMKKDARPTPTQLDERELPRRVGRRQVGRRRRREACFRGRGGGIRSRRNVVENRGRPGDNGISYSSYYLFLSRLRGSPPGRVTSPISFTIQGKYSPNTRTSQQSWTSNPQLLSNGLIDFVCFHYCLPKCLMHGNMKRLTWHIHNQGQPGATAT